MTKIIISSPLYFHPKTLVHQPRMREQGVTLVEMIVVMGIIALMLAIAIPNLMPQKFKVRSAAFNLRSHLMQARTEAVKMNEPVEVTINEEDNFYNSSSFGFVQLEKTLDLDLPDKNDIKTIDLTFSPIGIIFKNGLGTAYTIVVNGTNGMCIVEIKRSGRIYIDGECPK